MKLAISGIGYVGLVTATALASIGHDVICIDSDKNRINVLKEKKCPIYEPKLEKLMYQNQERLVYTTDYKNAYKDSDVIIVCVGTPENSNGSVNLDSIHTVCEQIADSITTNCVVAIKSTVPIGTNDKIQKLINTKVKSHVKVTVVSNPEFLSQGTAIHDTLYSSRIIVGTNDEKAKNIMFNVYRKLTEKPYNVPYFVTTARNAEMIKYASNSFLALKISYINEIANLCEKLDANIDDVSKGIGFDSRIGNQFLNAGIGYGGSCLPKDTKALYWQGNYNEIDLEILNACIRVNEKQKLILFNKLINDLRNLKGKKIAVLGLTFKPETDDLRYAPSIDNIKMLLNHGAIVGIYDPISIDNFKKKINLNNSTTIEYFTSIDETISNADAVMIMTNWNEIVNYDIYKYEKLMKSPRIYDGRNCYNLNVVNKYNLFYRSIGRPLVNNLKYVYRDNKRSNKK